MFFILFFILYCNIYINSLLFSYNKFSFSRYNNIILKAKYNINSINPKHILISDDNMPIIYSKINVYNINLKKNNILFRTYLSYITYVIRCQNRYA